MPKAVVPKAVVPTTVVEVDLESSSTGSRQEEARVAVSPHHGALAIPGGGESPSVAIPGGGESPPLVIHLHTNGWQLFGGTNRGEQSQMAKRLLHAWRIDPNRISELMITAMEEAGVQIDFMINCLPLHDPSASAYHLGFSDEVAIKLHGAKEAGNLNLIADIDLVLKHLARRLSLLLKVLLPFWRKNTEFFLYCTGRRRLTI